jgi:hypothetical protein
MPNNPQKFNQGQVSAILSPIGPSEIPANPSRGGEVVPRPFFPLPPHTTRTETPPTLLSNSINPPEVAEHDTIIDDCMRSVTVDDLASGAIVDVYINGVWRGSAKAPTVSAGLVHAEVPLAVCSLKIGDRVQATQSSGGQVSTLSDAVRVVSHVPYSVLTQHYNMGRTGWYPYAGMTWFNEDVVINGGKQQKALPTLTVDSVSKQFQKTPRFRYPVDGKVYAQPLYMHHQYFPQVGAGEAHNVIYLATEGDSVYAFDADAPGSINNGVILWKRETGGTTPLIPPGHVPVPSGDANSFDISPMVGISSTPVIDCGCRCSSCESECGCGSDKRASHCGCCRTPTIFLVCKTKRISDNSYHIFLHALDAVTGAERPNSPVEVAAQVKGSGGNPFGTNGGSNDGMGHIVFNPQIHNNRPGLLLLNGRIYIGFGSHGDQFKQDYHGWVISYDAITLEQKNVFCATPDDDPSNQYGNAGIWQSGMGLASDGHSIYCTTANGPLSANRGGQNYGDAVLKLDVDLNVASWFAPSNADTLLTSDNDLGSGGVLVVPSEFESSSCLIVTAGKDGQIFLLERNYLGGYVSPTSGDGYNYSPNAVFVGLIRPGAKLNPDGDQSPGVLGGAAYYNGPQGPVIYYCGNGIAGGTPELVGFSLINNILTNTKYPKLASNTDIFSYGGSIPVVSSDQHVPQTGVLWVVQRALPSDQSNTEGIPHSISLFAYDATDLTNAILKIPLGTWQGAGHNRALIEPTVINGRVYVAFQDATANNFVGVFY